MNNLQNYTDLAIIQPGVAILSLLTTRVSQNEKLLGQGVVLILSLIPSVY
jgi:hypothetical protein